MLDAGILNADERLELLDGEVLTKTTQSRGHVRAVRSIADRLALACGAAWHVEAQSPIALADDSEPEPDVAVVRGAMEDYEDHPEPEHVGLLVEVSDSSLPVDRGRKASAYARVGIREYWILNLRSRTLEVHRLAAGGGSESYTEVRTLTAADSIAPLFDPEVSLPVDELLGP
jgi:Uma2 family endonuclease